MSAAVKQGYKQTEVGVIPEDWEVLPLSRVVEQLDAGVSVNSLDEDLYDYSNEYAILKTSAIYGGTFFPFESKKIASFDIGRAKLNPRAYSIIISRMNTPDLVGECGYVFDDWPFLFLPDRLWMTRFRLGAALNVRWLSYVLSSRSYKLRIKGLATGTSGSMKNIAKDAFLAIPVAFPSFAEQEAIAEALSDADALIESLEQLIAKKRQIKQGAMQELLTGKKRLPGFSGEWEIEILGDIAIVIKGSQLHSEDVIRDGMYAHLNGGITPSGFTDKLNTPANSIAISEGGNSCGYVQFMTEPYWCGGHCYSVVPKHVDNKYLYHALKNQQPSIMGLRVGSGLPNVQKTALLSFKIIYPANLSEQTAIASVLSDMDAEIDALELKLVKARWLKQGMMHNLLTGKIRLV
jgi:type I restriction enzyme, S subunit